MGFFKWLSKEKVEKWETELNKNNLRLKPTSYFDCGLTY